MSAPSSANTSAPANEMMPPTIHTRMSAPGDGRSRATPSGPPVTMKTAEPMTSPMTRRVESHNPSARTSPVPDSPEDALPLSGAARASRRSWTRGVVGTEVAAGVGAEAAFHREPGGHVEVQAGDEVEERLAGVGERGVDERRAGQAAREARSEVARG